MTNKNLRFIFANAQLVICCSALLLLTSCQPRGEKKVVAKVGSYSITVKDVELRNQLIRVRYPNYQAEREQNPGLEQLVRFYTYAQILNNYGKKITESDLKEESSRIENQTKDRETLEKIKAIFGNDKDAYLRVFILPTYAERTIFPFFSQNTALQEMAEKNLKEFLEELKAKPAEIKPLASARGYSVNRLSLSEKSGFQSKAVIKTPGDSQDGEKKNFLKTAIQKDFNRAEKEQTQYWITQVVEPTKEGNISDTVVSGMESWTIVKVLKKNSAKKIYELETIEVPKANFSDWLEAERKKTSVEYLETVSQVK